MAILTPYKVNSYRRICDICGRPRQIEDIRFSENVAICKLHPEFRTAQQLNKINARVRAPRLLPVPQPKPFAPVDTWTAEEAQVFNFVTATAPFETVNVTSNAGTITGAQSIQAAGWAAIYLAALIEENKRPAAWIARARTAAATCGDYLISIQFSYSDLTFGGSVHQGNAYLAQDNAVACAAFCRLYQTLGTAKYLAAARRVGDFLVNLQATNLWTAPSVSPRYLGALPEQYNFGAGEFSTLYHSRDVLGLWSLSLLKGLTGDVTVGCTTTDSGVFSSPPAKLLSQAIADIRSFWATGVAGVTGLSATTPFNRYNTAGGWENSGLFGTVLDSNQWPLALFALAEVDGVSDQVAVLWDYLMSYTTSATLGGGDYDPKLAMATGVDTSTKTNSTTFYDWAASGLMARIESSRDRASLKRAKDAIGVPRARFAEATPRSGDYLYLGPLGRSRLDFLPYTSTTQRLQSVIRASQAGLLYRQQPQGFLGRGH